MLIAITSEAHGGGNYSAPFAVRAVKSFEDAAAVESEECARKNKALAAEGLPARWTASPLLAGDGTGDIDVTYCGKPQYLVQVRSVGDAEEE